MRHLSLIALIALVTVPDSLASSTAAAARIDALVEANLTRLGQRPNPPIDESTFLLLDSEAHVSHFFNFWTDILRLQDDVAGGRNAAIAYHLWVKQAIRENRPYDYQYPDAKPGDAVAPATRFGATADLKADGVSPIEAYSSWITSPENPTFTIEDADHHRPLLRGQIAAIERERLTWESLEGRSPAEYIALMERIAPLIHQRDREKIRVQDLMLAAQKKGDQAAVTRLKEEYRAIEEPLRKAKAEIVCVKLAGFDPGKMESGGQTPPPANAVKPELKLPDPPADLKGSQLEAWHKDREAERTAYGRMWPQMARASELESPAPRGHFLRDFGQSDSEMIENAADNASVPQALNLLNGQFTDVLTNPFTVFGAKINAAAPPEEKARAIFQAMLTREPTARELDLVKDEVAQSGESAYAGIVWALLNTQQFRFLR